MLGRANVTYGTDPEGFFQRDGRIVGSEKVLPERGVPGVVLDGVQFELNPPPSTSVYGLGLGISKGFQQIHDLLRQQPGTSLNFNGVVEVSREELDSLSDRSRVLGCMPSKNIYGDKPITVDAREYRKRSAGGHIHMGLGSTTIFNPNGMPDKRERLVPLCDIFVGNFCVLLDRDPGAAERRENYGRAGEYRLPKYGLEYRTPSNFWLRSYPLMSFTFGMAALAVAVLHETLNKTKDLEQELVNIVDIDKFVRAIDSNSFDLAAENVLTLRPFFNQHVTSMAFPVNDKSFNKFLLFAEQVNKRGIDYYFPAADIVSDWCNFKGVEFLTFLGV